MIKKVKLSAAEWRQRLSPEVYAITRAAETEPPFSGEYWDQHNKGIYHCACCRLELFHSRDKYDSGTGWPSFNQPIVATNINNRADHSRFPPRTKVVCASCDAHLGHVFPEPAQATGQRYCINSAALEFFPE